MGERLATRTWPKRLQSGELTVAVVSSRWLNELSFLRSTLVEQINQAFSHVIVRSIRLVVGLVQETLPPRGAVPTPAPPVSSETATELELVANEAVPPLPDSTLRSAIVSARKAQLLAGLK